MHSSTQCLFLVLLFLSFTDAHTFPHQLSPSDEPRSGVCPFSRFQNVARCSCYVASRDGLLNRGLVNLCIAALDTPVTQFFSACSVIGVVQKKCAKPRFFTRRKPGFFGIGGAVTRHSFFGGFIGKKSLPCIPDVDELQIISKINSTLAECPLSRLIAESRIIVGEEVQSEENSLENELLASQEMHDDVDTMGAGDTEEEDLRPALASGIGDSVLSLGGVVSRACNVKKKTATIWLLTQLGRVLVKRYRPAAFRGLPSNYFQVTYGVRCFVGRMTRMVQLTPRAMRLLLYNGMIGGEKMVVRNRREGDGISACKAALRNGRRRITCVCRRVRKWRVVLARVRFVYCFEQMGADGCRPTLVWSGRTFFSRDFEQA